MKQQWNDTDRRKLKYSKKNVSQCHFVHHKPHTDWPGYKPGHHGDNPATNCLNYGKVISINNNVTRNV
jgi:hypothetical protein